MAASRPLTRLHISDRQFGRNHLFGRLQIPLPDQTFDSLAQRLRQDIALLQRDHALQVDVLVASGDLAEWGLPQEFHEVHQLLEGLTELLHLSRERVILVPGNHDINRHLCAGYFSTCAGEGQEPVPPFWPKWKNYHAMFQEFYRGVPGAVQEFTVEHPWTWFEIPDLKLVVAGLNSTIAEIHDVPQDDPHFQTFVATQQFGHFGYVGERQLQWFADKLRPYQRDGWLRLGVVHHNVRRGAVDDDENLRDAEDLFRLLGPHLNLLLHGHTHNGKQDFMPNGVVPILSTGSTGLAMQARPEEVPNQYQFIQLWPDRLKRWTRRYDPGQKRWTGDTRCSDKGDTWQMTQPVRLQDVATTFPASVTPRRTRRPVARHRPADDLDEPYRRDRRQDDIFPRPDTFLERVRQVCTMRYPTADVTPQQTADAGLAYLRVTVREDVAVQQFPVGVCEEGLSQDVVGQFLQQVDAPYRAVNPQMISQLVYGGQRAAEDLITQARRRGLWLQSFVEYQGLHDFGRYVESQTQRLANDPIYPANLYVSQQLQYGLGSTSLSMPQHETTDALALVAQWITDEQPGRFVLLLGDFGTGKTFLLRQLAQHLAHIPGAPVPILIELRALQKTRTLNELVAQHLVARGEHNLDIDKFRHMLKSGRIALLFDGFDELAQRVTYDSATEHFDTLLEAADGQAKVVVTSRTQHFISDAQVEQAILQHAKMVTGLRLCRLQPFTDTQIYDFLYHKLGDAETARQRFALIQDIRDLAGLSRTPRMLSFIAELPEQKLLAARNRTGEMTAARLYRTLITHSWLRHEYERSTARGGPPTLSVLERRRVVTELALHMWSRRERTMTAQDIARLSPRLLQRLGERRFDADEIAHLIAAGTLLGRDEDNVFTFVHQSIMEWLVANRAAVQLRAGQSPDSLTVQELSSLMVGFFCDVAGSKRARLWAQAILAQTEEAAEIARKNALMVLNRMGETSTAPAQLARQDLRGHDLSRQALRLANLAGADLTDARLVETDLTGANLEGAVLLRADLRQAKLVQARLNGVKAVQANLMGADLRGTTMQGASLRRARLVGATIEAATLAQCDSFGAAMPDASLIALLTASVASPCRAVAFHPDGDLVASGHDDGSVRLWAVATAQELRRGTGHTGGVLSVAFSPDGQQVVSGSSDGSVRLWDVATGQELRRGTGHTGGVWSVVFSPDGQQVVSGSGDQSVRLWDVATGQELCHGTGHTARVWSVAFSPDGQQVVSGSADRSVRLWAVATGEELRRGTGHTDRVLSVAFSPDGQQVVSGSADGSMRLWAVATGEELCRGTGHTDEVSSVAFSPDGQQVVSGSADGSVRLWDVATGQELRRGTGHRGGVSSVAFSPNGQQVVSGSADGSMRLWAVATGEELRRGTGHTDRVWSVAFSPDGQQVVSGSTDGSVRLWTVATGQELRRCTGHMDWVSSVAFSPDGQQVVSGSTDGSVRLWDVATGQELRRCTGHTGRVWSVAFSPDGQQVVSGNADRSVRLWAVATGEELFRCTDHTDGVLSVAFSPDGQQVVSGSADGSVRLWAVATGRQLRYCTGHTDRVWSVAFSPNGQQVVSGSADGSMRLWAVATGHQLRRGTGHTDGVLSVAFSPNGQQVVSGSADGSVRLWVVATGQELRRGTGHTSEVWSVAFSPDGQQVVSGSADGSIRLWDVVTGACLLTLFGTPDGWVAFTPHGQYKFAGDLAGRFWFLVGLCRFEPGELDAYLPPGRLQHLPLDAPMLLSAVPRQDTPHG